MRRTRRHLHVALLVALVLGALLSPSVASGASEGGPLTQSCRGVNESLRGPCRGVEQLAAAGSATCRYAGRNAGVVQDTQCATPLGPRVSAAAVDAYEGSWVHRALELQYELAGDVGLRNAPWVGTHNSFNSTAEMGPTLSDTDANQQLSLIDQLRLDVRSLELDVHLFPRAQARGSAPVVCHALGNHGGCTIEKPLDQVLGEIAAWLDGHSDQVLLLYLEDHLDNQAGYDAGAAALETELGDRGLLYRPAGGASCTPLPLDLAREEILATGAQAIVMSGCGVGEAWPAVAFDGSPRKENRPHAYSDFPNCDPDPQFDRAAYNATMIRYFEDSTGVTAGAATVGAASHDDGITPTTAARMARCGVDLLGMDQLLPDDGRLEALVWSWARDEPRDGAGDCAIQRPDGRWETRSCAERQPVACRAADGSWSISAKAVPAAAAPTQCRKSGGTHAVPRSGYETQLLRVTMQQSAASEVWLGYRRTGGSWAPLDSR